MIDASIFGFQFFQYALIGGTITGITCALIGIFTLLRREALIGEGIAHLSLGGIAVGLFFGIYPLYTALIFSILAMLVITWIRRKGIAHSDAAIGLIIAFGLSTALILISLADGFNVELFTYLFGSILTITITDLTLISIISLAVIIFFIKFYKELLAMTFDEETARLSGVPVEPLTLVLNIIVALTIVLSIKVVGIFLVSALLIIPATTALQWGASFKKTMLISTIVAALSVFSGVMFSALYEVSSSGLIIFTALCIFIFSVAYTRLGDDV